MSGALRRIRPEHQRAAVEAAAAAFPPGNPHGVFGVAIQRRRVRGRELGYPTLALFVERKLDDPRAAIEPIVFRHRRAALAVLPDVVATGSEAAASRGARAVFTGLHPGAAIRIASGRRCAGGVACLLTLDDRPTHLLTAGHLFPPGSGSVAVRAASGPRGAEVDVGRLARNLLDASGRGIDVALVGLTEQGIDMAIQSARPSRAPVLRATPFVSAFVDAARLKVYLSRTGDYQPLRTASIGPSVFQLRSDCRPPHRVADVIATDFANNTRGNSGTILMTDEDPVGGAMIGSAVGVAIGFAGAMSLHEPLDRALRAIRSATDRAFKIWSPRP